MSSIRVKMIFTFVLTALFVQASAAQFNIKVPKIKKPTAEKKTSGARSGGSQNILNARPKSRENVIDDAFTYFEAIPVTKRDANLARDVDDGWILKSWLRVMGTYPKRSAFKITILKNGKVLANQRCMGGRYVYNSKAVPRMAYFGDNWLWYDTGCWAKKNKVMEVGMLDVQIRVINGDTDEETLVRTYKIDVQKISRVAGPVSKPYQNSSQYMIMRHADTAVAFIHYRVPGMKDYYNQANRALSDTPTMQLYFNMSEGANRKSPGSGYLRCSVNGTRIKFPGEGDTSDEMYAQKLRTTQVQYSDRLAAKYKRGPSYKDPLRFVQMFSVLPIRWAGDGKKYDRLDIQSKPGKWECKFMNNGETYRTFRFEVASNGSIVPHPEQANGNVNLYHNAFMIDMEIPEGGTEFDYRLGPVPEKGFFYGIPWSTPEGKAMASRVPKKGSLLPTPSNKRR